MTRILPAVCERSKEFASLGLDGELAELERRMLDAHLARCGPCREEVGELAMIAAAVRSTPLDPVDALVTQRFRRPWSGRLRPVAAVAATLPLGLGAGGAVRHAGEPGLQRAQEPVRWPVPTKYLSDKALLAEQQHIAMSRPGHAPLQLRF